MKKIFIFLALIALSLTIYGCGGGGAGSADTPGGENPGLPSVVQLMPAQFISQTNGCITLNTKVLDGNGAPVKAVPVTFTNLSHPLGELRHACNPASAIVNSPINTDNSGIAKVYLLSNDPGFATILAQVYIGAGQVRDRKTVYFTTKDVLKVTMDLDVDSVPPSSQQNELSDFTLFENSDDDTVEITATVRDAGGVPVGGGMSVLWSRSHTEATWVRIESSTNIFGKAKTVVKVEPASIRNTETHVNIMAFAGNGAANMVTLFLRPVVPDPATSSLTANPSVVSINGTSTIRAIVMLNTGSRAPDGTTVNFTVKPKTPSDPSPCGVVTPFAQTTGGVAQATFTAPPIPGTCTITGKVAGIIIGTVDILVTVPLSVQPPSQNIDGIAGGVATYQIFGGIAPYTITSTNPLFPPIPSTVTASGGSFSVNVPPNTPTTSVTYTIRDSAGSTVTATLSIAGARLTVLPISQTINGAPGGTASFKIFGGKPGYQVFTSNPSFPPDPSTVALSGGTFTVTIPPNTPATKVTYTVRDSLNSTVDATLEIIFASTDYYLLPAGATITVGSSVTFGIFGGTEPFEIFQDSPAIDIIYDAISDPRSFTVVGVNSGNVKVTVRDANGRQIEANIIVQ